MAQMLKKLPAMQENWVQYLGRVCQSNVIGEGFSQLWLALKREESQGMEKAKNFSPGASRKELSLANTLILAQ